MELITDESKQETQRREGDGHPGCVKRILSVKDRLIIFQALNQAVAQGGDSKELSRLMQLRESLNQEGVDDYYAAQAKEFAKRIQVWATAFEKHIKLGEEDPGAKPKETEQEILGHEATYWIKSKLDSHIQDKLRVSKWGGDQAKYVVTLFKKFEIAIEE